MSTRTTWSHYTILFALAACNPDAPSDGAESVTAGAISGDTVEYLFVQSAEGATLADGILTLRGVGASTVYFSDRPERIAGQISTEFFAASWDQGTASFASDPPNATLSVLAGAQPQEVVLVLRNPQLSESMLVYEVEILEGNDAVAGGASVLFIDTLGRPATPHSVAGHERRVHRR